MTIYFNFFSLSIISILRKRSLAIESSLISVVLKKVLIDFIFDFSRHKIVKFWLIHGQFTDQRARNVDPARACLQKNCLFLGQTPIDNSHRKLVIKVRERSHSPDKKVNVVFLHKIRKKALNTDNFNFFAQLPRDFSQKPLSVLNWKYWPNSKKNI